MKINRFLIILGLILLVTIIIFFYKNKNKNESLYNFPQSSGVQKNIPNKDCGMLDCSYTGKFLDF